VEKYYNGKDPLQITDALDKLMENHLRKFINDATDNIAQYQNYYKKTIVFKREAIGSGFWCGKKKYAIKVYNNEGVTYKDGDYKILGLEVVRSSTPEIARDALRVIDKEFDKLKQVVAQTHEQFKTVDIERIAFPRSANNLKEYSSTDTIYTRGCPIAVRGALLHNHFLNELNLGGVYQPIEEGSKLLFIYLKEPNHFKENVIAFTEKLPPEFKLHKYIDRELQFEKVFLAPLKGILDAVGVSLEEKNDLEEFF
jgi:DNA polymerase elongation subunit (family B)